MRIFLVIMLAGACRHPKPAPPGAVSIASLFEEMIDLDHLTRVAHFRTRQASSYDRASTAPDRPGWFANRDYGQFVREDGDEAVLLDVDGPGAIVRIWSANPTGTLRIYIDGERVLKAPMQPLLDGDDPLFPSPLAHVAARGHNLYYPFPFARHCKVTFEGVAPPGLYYQIDYRVYPAGTAVDSFSLDKAREAGVRRIARRLREPDEPRGELRRFSLAKPFVVDAQGGVLTELVLHAGEEDLHGIVLEMRFDGNQTVSAPLDALFGSGFGLAPYRSLPMEMSSDGTLRMRWPMPFGSRAEIAQVGGAPLDGEVRVAPRPFTADSLYFHARRHAPEDLPTTQPRDWNLVTVDGRGQYVGNTLDAVYFEHSWWGEGDEKIWVDDERFPGWFGTGTEDYYGYAWCSTRKFAEAYHTQTVADGPVTDRVGLADGFGRTSVSRFHVIDPIPFDHHFRFDLEVLDWHHRSHLQLDAVAYYYSRDTHAP